MYEKTRDFKAKDWFALIIVILIIVDFLILLNIPFLRQIFGFLFFTIFPGLLILQILKLDKLGYTEKFVLVVGLSISFLMLFGLLINNLSLHMGYKTPLAAIPLLISFNIAFIVLAIVGYKINKDVVFSLPNLNLSTSEKAFLIIPIFFPALSIFGIYVMNTTNNNIILMFMLFLIPIYVAFVCVSNQKFPKRLYPVVIFLISISLLLLLSLRSNYIIGIDAHEEYYFFQVTLDNLHWSVFGYSPVNACLVISLLPTIYQSLLNIMPEFLFKILYSLIFSVSPLVIYVISKKYVEKRYAFLASCFFMFQLNFLWTELHARTNIAILFFALAMMTLFNDRMEPLKKRVLFIVFMVSCMTSHYSTTYIFFFIMFGSFFGIEILSKRYAVKKVISLNIAILFFAMIFFWYSQVTEIAFNAGVKFIEYTIINLNKFFLEGIRSTDVQALFGEGIQQKGIPHMIEFVFTWLTFMFIAIGAITMMKRYKEMSFPELKFKKLDFLKNKFEVTYFVVTFLCSGLLVAIVVFPFVSVGYSPERLYTQAIVILSVFFVIGAIVLSKQIYKKHFISGSVNRGNYSKGAYLIMLLVLIPYFLCTTGVMYNIFGVPRSIILNSEGERYDIWYVHDQESYSAKWLRENGDLENITVYADSFSGGRLLSQAGIISSDTYPLFEEDRRIDGYIYLRYYNVVNKKLYMMWKSYNISEYQDKFVDKNKVYDNGGSEIYL